MREKTGHLRRSIAQESVILMVSMKRRDALEDRCP